MSEVIRSTEPRRYPAKPRPGDRVAVLSPSAGLPAVFPHVYELGLRRLRDDFGLIPVEYPTTRAAGAHPRERARDLTAAFADPSITAVLATVGGDDLITVLPYLDPEVLAANPKPYFGYSDNTNVLSYLFELGLVSYHGGSVLVHLGRPGALHPDTAASLRAALFTDDWYELTPATEYGDQPNDWRDPATLATEPVMLPAEGWHWHGPQTVVEGPIWGGNLEILSWLLQAGRVGPNDAYAGCVLLLETSEELPSDVEVFRILRNMGERGLLAGFPARAGRPPEGVGLRAAQHRRAEAGVRRRAACRRAPGAGRVRPGRGSRLRPRRRPHRPATDRPVRRPRPRRRDCARITVRY